MNPNSNPRPVWFLKNYWRLIDLADWVSFTELLKSLDTTNGNLSVHLGKLVEAGYVEEVRRFVGRRSQSRYRLTRTGRKALLDHVATLQELAGQHLSRSL